jgi:hypothetical protein
VNYQVIASVCWCVLFGLIGAGFAAADAPPWSIALAVVAIIAAQQLYCQILMPRGARARLLKAVDPTVGPPPGARPADSTLVSRLDALSDARDWDGLRALLSDDFAIVVGKRRFGQRVYIRRLKTTDRLVPGERKTDEIVVHPNEPDVLWIRSTSSGQPRFGPRFITTTWTRVRLTSDGSRVREIATVGVLSAA